MLTELGIKPKENMNEEPTVLRTNVRQKLSRITNVLEENAINEKGNYIFFRRLSKELRPIEYGRREIHFSHTQNFFAIRHCYSSQIHTDH